MSIVILLLSLSVTIARFEIRVMEQNAITHCFRALINYVILSENSV